MIEEDPWQEKSHDSKVASLDLNQLQTNQNELTSPTPHSAPDDDLLSPELLEDGWGCD